MRILHYSLGFPPYRRGGLTKYCLDLMAAQEMQGNVVALSLIHISEPTRH